MLNRAEVVGASSPRRAGRRGRRSRSTATTVDVRARVVVNAAGPWVDEVRRLESPRAGTSVRLSKGAHVLVPGGEDWSAALTVPQDDVRVTFAVPWYGLLLLGTTDTDFDGDPATVSVEPADVVADPRRGRQGAAAGAARTGRGPRVVRRPPRAPARRRRDGDRAARDGVLRSARAGCSASRAGS